MPIRFIKRQLEAEFCTKVDEMEGQKVVELSACLNQSVTFYLSVKVIVSKVIISKVSIPM